MTPQNVQARWTLAEEVQLVFEFRAGWALLEICKAHNRTPNAIITRLNVLGELVQLGKAYHATNPTPYLSFEQIKAVQRYWLEHQGERA